MDIINENKLGITKGTEVQEAVDMNFKGENSEVGIYLAMSRQSQRQGYPEIAEVLKTIAFEEAWHAARFAELNGHISADTKTNLENMLKGEIGANNGKKQAATKAKEAGIDEAHDFFDESSRDEARHANALKGLISRYFEK